jgi:hypothetical protein
MPGTPRVRAGLFIVSRYKYRVKDFAPRVGKVLLVEKKNILSDDVHGAADFR